MQVVVANTFDDWRAAARSLVAAAVQPADVRFEERSSQRGLFAESDESKWGTAVEKSVASHVAVATAARVPKRFLELAKWVACHRDRARFEVLYRVLWRLSHGEPHLLDVETDEDVARLTSMEKSVRRDAHKMKAFVRFRRVVMDGEERFIAWHRPDHHVVRLVAPFFSRRFPEMHWSILTPEESVHWDQELTYSPGVPASEAPQSDELEEMWKTYYASIFNPARIKVKAMKREMPVRHWKTLPETALIPELLADSPRRVAEMIERGAQNRRSAAEYLPAVISYEQLRGHAATCRGCELYCNATQTVFGVGPVSARLMLVGEQPGDMEDRAGEPFVGPAGQLLDEALEEAGLFRREIYLTNAVKHFKFVLRGKRRIHSKPSIQEAIACRPWLLAELEMVKPDVVLCLGATAAQALIGSDFRITQQRGEVHSTTACERTIATYHPSAVLRSPDEGRRRELRGWLVTDLQKAAGLLERGVAGGVEVRRG